VHINLKTDYALRAILEIAARGPDGKAASRDEIASQQEIPPRYLASILNELRKGELVTALRGPDGGYRIARPADSISLADVIRVVDGALTQVGGRRPESISYQGAARELSRVWFDLRAVERQILENTTLLDLLRLQE
jgi:Rrf2 family protein